MAFRDFDLLRFRWFDSRSLLCGNLERRVLCPSVAEHCNLVPVEKSWITEPQTTVDSNPGSEDLRGEVVSLLHGSVIMFLLVL